MNDTPTDQQAPLPPGTLTLPEPKQSKIETYRKAHNFNGNDLILDPKTGYLESRLMYSGFTAAKKLECVKVAESLWPNLTAIARHVGVDRVTITNHLTVDAKFKHDLEQAGESSLDNIEGYMSQRALTPGGYMDRITLLRAYRAARYDRDRKVTVEHVSTISPQDRAKRISELRDATLIDVQATELNSRELPQPTPTNDTPAIIQE